MIQQLTLSLSGVKHEQEYMQVRDRVHRASKLLQFLYCQVIKNSFTLKEEILQEFDLADLAV